MTTKLMFPNRREDEGQPLSAFKEGSVVRCPSTGDHYLVAQESDANPRTQSINGRVCYFLIKLHGPFSWSRVPDNAPVYHRRFVLTDSTLTIG